MIEIVRTRNAYVFDFMKFGGNICHATMSNSIQSGDNLYTQITGPNGINHLIFRIRTKNSLNLFVEHV